MTENAVELVFRNAISEETSDRVDIAIKDEKIVAMQKNYVGHGAQEVDASGLMVSPLFIDPHHHLDCAYLDEYTNYSGTLEEAIEINAKIKGNRAQQEIRDKACRALNEALLYGTGWMRSHGDIDSVSKLDLMYPVLEAKERYRGLVDVQFVAFPQLGFVRDPKSIDYMRAAMQEGADVVGGMPHGEESMEDAARHIDICFEIAKEFNVDIDMHIDETDDPNSRTLELLADVTIREGYQGRVTAGHCCALATYEDEYAKRVIEKVADAEINVITNPMVNLYLQGHNASQPAWRGITRVKNLMGAGVNISCGQDDVKNMFLPFGKMDMLDVALMTVLVAQLTTPQEIQAAFDMPRFNAAKVMRLDEYGLEVGSPANFVLIEATNAAEALRLQPPRRYVVRNGHIVAETIQQSILHSQTRSA